MAYPGFFLFLNNRKIFAAETFAKRGQKLAVMRQEGVKGNAAKVAIKAALPIVNKSRTLDQSVADAVSLSVKPHGFKAFFIPGDFNYPSRISIIPE